MFKYLLRLCFTGYFQIFVSPKTFWLKDFNLHLRFYMRLLLSKKQPIPHLNVFCCFNIYNAPCYIISFLPCFLISKKIFDASVFHQFILFGYFVSVSPTWRFYGFGPTCIRFPMTSVLRIVFTVATAAPFTAAPISHNMWAFRLNLIASVFDCDFSTSS